MAKTRMQHFNFVLFTLSIIMGVVMTATAIIAIWSEEFRVVSSLRVTGSAGVVLAACAMNWMVNAAFGPRLGRLFPNLCYGTTMVTIYVSLLLIQLAIWSSVSSDFILKSIGTLLVLLFASLLTLVFTSVAPTVVQAPPPADKQGGSD